MVALNSCLSLCCACAKAIIEHCRVLIGGYKVPRRIEFVDEMPKNELGKILKNRLRETYAS